MRVKGKYQISKKHRKTSLAVSDSKKFKGFRTFRRKYSKYNKTYRKKKYMRGGNYERDVTVQTYLNFPMKQSNKVVTTVPGRGVMSVSAYKNLMETEERNGFDFYD
jgi:hypothetical protein